jgi:hypothetical protein
MNTKWLFFYVLLSFSFDTLGFIITKTNLLSSWLHYMIHIFTILQFLLLSIYFYRQKIFSKKKILLSSLIISFGLVSYIFFLAYEKLPIFNIYGSAIVSLILILYCFLGFKKLAIAANSIYLERSASFWVLSGFILYFSGSFFVFTFGRYIQSENMEYFLFLWIFVHDFLNTVKNICLAVSFTRKTE